MLEAVRLTKKFRSKKGEVIGIDQLSFRVSPGEVFGLLGPNGAGKTTTLRIISTLMQPDSGDVWVEGLHNVRQSAEARRRIGYLSNETGIYERLSPRQQLRFFAEISGMERNDADNRIEELTDRLGMSEFIDRRVNRFSTGMKQKVAIARALLHRPSVILLDEPTTGLDLLAARSVIQTIRQLKEEGKTIVLSTHIMSEAEQLCDRIGIIYKGTLFANGTVEELRQLTGKTHMDDVFFAIVGEEQV